MKKTEIGRDRQIGAWRASVQGGMAWCARWRIGLLLLLLLCGVGLTARAQSSADLSSLFTTTADYAGLQDFGDPRAGELARRFWAVESGRSAQPFSIVQFGDSHTASDPLTVGLREGLQQWLGDSGVGWLPPMDVPGQSHQRVNLTSQGWQLTSSFQDTSSHFPLGGNIATPVSAGATIQVAPWWQDERRYQATFLVRPTHGAVRLMVQGSDGQSHPLTPKGTSPSGWGLATVPVRLPFVVVAPTADAGEVGGIWLSRPGVPGALVSPIGINGVRQTVWNAWSPDWYAQLAWFKPDLVVIAYGTNETFDPALDVKATADSLATGIRQIRKANPRVAVLILGAPPLMDPTQGAQGAHLSCAERLLPMHEVVRKMQQDVARQEKTLYWDWEAAMGGACAALSWQQAGWIAADSIHFTIEGYREVSRRLFRAMANYLMRVRPR